MDFSATVRLEDGSPKLVLIEIQKANNAWDVQRFRRYLGCNYCNPENVYLDSVGRQQALRRLLRAGAEKDIRDGMDVEDDVVAAFQEQARKSAQALEEKDRVIEAKDKALEDKERALERKDQIIADLKRRLGRL